jgi:hypothetical protein
LRQWGGANSFGARNEWGLQLLGPHRCVKGHWTECSSDETRAKAWQSDTEYGQSRRPPACHAGCLAGWETTSDIAAINKVVARRVWTDLNKLQIVCPGLSVIALLQTSSQAKKIVERLRTTGSAYHGAQYNIQW